MINMSPKELLKPRYKVKIKYTYSVFNVGDILYFKHDDYWLNVMNANKEAKVSMIHINWVKDCPDVFEKLEWWKDRELI